VPDAGEHETVTGATPPEMVGAGKATAVLAPVVPAVTLAGQLMLGAPGTGGGVGAVGVVFVPSPQPKARAATSTMVRRFGIPTDEILTNQYANSYRPGVTSTRFLAGKDRLEGASRPAARNCTVRSFSPSAP
jgi:hypothetical protein